MKISYTYIIYGLFLTLFSGCELIHDDPAELGFREDGEAYAYVSLTIHTAPTDPGTRANPTGGEAGDGYEDGQDYEKAVNDLTLFFYSNNGGVNGTSVPLISHYINASQTLTDGTQPIDETFTLGPVRVSGLRTNQQYHLLVVANAGDISDDYATLDDLRNADLSTVYTYDPDETEPYSNFVMSSEGDEDPVLNITYENSENNPATTTVDLERLVARVDYKTAGGNSYKVDETGITASITRAMLVNMYNQNTYVLKRVASDINGTPDYLDDETYNNYVIDPNTSQKTLPSNHGDWYGHYFPSLSDANSTTWEAWLTTGDPIKDPEDANAETWYRLGYPKENTSSVDAQGKYYSTGVVFEAEYDGLGDDFTKGKTFFRVNENKLYPTLEKAMEAHDSNFNANRTSFSGYDDLQEYLEILEDNDPAGYKAYLLTAQENEEGGYSKYDWSNYKTEVLGYDVDGNPTAVTRQALHERVVGENRTTETFLDGKGYYTYWIRHNYGGDEEQVGLPMGNAIVRNNVYKLTVNSISEIGNDVPGDKTLDILVAVAKWNVLNGESIDLTTGD